MLDPFSSYRATQVTSASPASQVVLLYQGAIRYGTQHVMQLQRRDLEAAHTASIRCQEIVSALRETLDLSAGPVADNLDALYAFILKKLVAGNIAKDPRPTEEAIALLRGLLEAWQQIASTTAGQPASTAAPGSVAVAAPVARAALRGAA